MISVERIYEGTAKLDPMQHFIALRSGEQVRSLDDTRPGGQQPQSIEGKGADEFVKATMMFVVNGEYCDQRPGINQYALHAISL